ncbi:hypothetical protein [Candidatus Protochlamydia phocaeensis]|uniref:hypothetical protein n=1 Tax=Candidatus Protochlamydia phocaeensis TaxID=1414722 RepID=UPI000838506C|nr:hypothetical protein [Candidatus Protochlamydia phocaeensis]
MNNNKDADDKFLITMSDIASLFRQSKGRIFRWALVMGLLGALVALIQPIRYRSEATFREKSNKSGGVSNSILQLLSSESLSAGQENEASSLIKSRKLMQNVIEKLKLQGQVELKCDEENIFRRIRRNLEVTWNALKRSPQPVLKDHQCPIQIVDLNYQGEIPLKFEVLLADNGEFDVRDVDHDHVSIGQGKLGVPFTWQALAFTLDAREGQTVAPQPLSLKIESMADTADALCKKLQIENAKNDKGVLKLAYDHRNRHAASEFLNTTMQCYQDHLKSHHDKLAKMQLDYLHNRQAQLANNLTELMQKHANFLANDLFNSGFVDSDKEMDFLAKSQHEYREKLLSNELEIKRLENIQPNSHVYYDTYNSDAADSIVINNVLTQIRDLKQRRDGLEIEIQKKAAFTTHTLHHSFDQQLEELKEVQRYIVELQDIIDRFHQHLLPDSETSLIKDPRFLIKGWFEHLDKLEGIDPVEWNKSRESFQFYLTNLERIFNVHEKMLQERLIHQQNPSDEYQGIDLRVADDLYMDYSKQLIQLESTIRQNLFFIGQMEDPNFEITSLSAGLNDSVSQEMIKKASNLVLTLKDQNNQSVREQERLKEELLLQRTFLSLHLEQMVQLMELNKKLIEEKVYALQNVSLDLINQQVSLLENTLRDYVESRLENLRQERTLIKQHLKHIHNEMGGLPKKWVAEQLIEQEVEINQLIVEEIAKMVESKNIAHNLEVIQSAPIDLATPPVHPVTPSVLAFAILGGLLGSFMGAGVVLGSSLIKGLKASADNLKLAGLYVAGSLPFRSQTQDNRVISDADLETIRRLQSYIDPVSLSSENRELNVAQRLLLLEGCGPDYSRDLSTLFLKKGKKVLMLYLDGDQAGSDVKNGLLQYLEGKASFPEIESGPYGDFIRAGGASRFFIELMGSEAFKKLINELQERYDWIIGISRASPVSAEAESLVPLFPYAAVTVWQEKVEDLDFYAQLANNPNRKVVFLIADSTMN